MRKRWKIVVFALLLLSQALGIALPILSDGRAQEMSPCPAWGQRQAGNSGYDTGFVSCLVYDAALPPVTTKSLSRSIVVAPITHAYHSAPVPPIRLAGSPRSGPGGKAEFVAAKSGSGALVPMSENLFVNGTSRTVAGYHVYGNAGLVGETYTVNILGLYAQEGAQGLRALSSAFKAEAQAAGATRISISGNTIINESISGFSPAAAQRFGFQLQKVNNQTIILTAPIAP